jgi:hypothetical protein
MGLIFHDAPNEIYLWSSGMIAALLCTVIMRLVYLLADGPARPRDTADAKDWWDWVLIKLIPVREYQSTQTNIASRGLRCLKVTAMLAFLQSIPMLTNYYGEPVTSLLDYASVNSGDWVLARFLLVAMTCACAYMFQDQSFFRIFSSLNFCFLGGVSLVSQIQMAFGIHCLETGACESEGVALDYLYFLAWMDLLGAVIMLTGAGLAMWLTGLFGACGNNLFLPRGEHRALSKKLDSMNMRDEGPKSRMTKMEAKLADLLHMQ